MQYQVGNYPHITDDDPIFDSEHEAFEHAMNLSCENYDDHMQPVFVVWEDGEVKYLMLEGEAFSKHWAGLPSVSHHIAEGEA